MCVAWQYFGTLPERLLVPPHFDVRALLGDVARK